ncbi:MAG: vacuolar protein sorting-associated protein 35-domain-containing protein [Olpidium bornovanus]|uniref:Vacuolar protein sorting-associated protein 35-domain-containing protein n=1 Tax=Olpidium bornovanus TaxID=278681 RepID=A0A8H8DJV6_9FUNG|nr:MAG: vacuolar protein sorting-associated protein 35-domain-containing protein [Olpidium bornovanus]
MSFRLFLATGQSADECGFEEIAYEFFVQVRLPVEFPPLPAFTIYEDSISESKAQFTAMTLLIGALQSTSVFSTDNYDTLITKCALHASKLLKKPDQCRAVYLCSHLFWATPDLAAANGRKKGGVPGWQKGFGVPAESAEDRGLVHGRLVKRGALRRDPQSIHILLREAERGGEDAGAEADTFFPGGAPNPLAALTFAYLNGLIDLINTNLGNVETADAVAQPGTSSSSALVEHPAGGSLTEYVHRHFRNTVAHLQARKEQRRGGGGADRPSYDEVDILSVLER